MVTLRHAFDANSMKGLVLKILRGTYPEIPSCYSQDLKDLISLMFIKDPAKRPSINKILEMDFLKTRISEMLHEEALSIKSTMLLKINKPQGLSNLQTLSSEEALVSAPTSKKTKRLKVISNPK